MFDDFFNRTLISNWLFNETYLKFNYFVLFSPCSIIISLLIRTSLKNNFIRAIGIKFLNRFYTLIKSIFFSNSANSNQKKILEQVRDLTFFFKLTFLISLVPFNEWFSLFFNSKSSFESFDWLVKKKSYNHIKWHNRSLSIQSNRSTLKIL